MAPILQGAQAAADPARLRLQQAETVRRKMADHQADRRLIDIFLGRRVAGLTGDGDAHGADPMLEAGGEAQLIDNGGQVLGQVIGDINKAQRMRARDGAKGCKAGAGYVRPMLAAGMGAGKGRCRSGHDSGVSNSFVTWGRMLPTITATPSLVGCSPSC